MSFDLQPKSRNKQTNKSNRLTVAMWVHVFVCVYKCVCKLGEIERVCTFVSEREKECVFVRVRIRVFEMRRNDQNM